MLPQPIPLRCRDNGGAGFLVTDGNHVWLTTCVHLVTGLINTPPNLHLFKGAQFQVLATDIFIPLFVAAQQRFMVVINHTTGNLIDVLAIKLSPLEIKSLVLFGMYELRTIVQTEVGEIVTARGFPGISQMVLTAATLEAAVDKVEGVSICLSKASVKGFSGGPVESDRGLVGILHGDLHPPPNLTNALVNSFDVVASQLYS